VILSEGIKLLFFLLILISNLIFFAYWISKFYEEMKLMVLMKMGGIYLIICLCNNKNKLERKKISAMKEEENEILREDYLKCNKLKLI